MRSRSHNQVNSARVSLQIITANPWNTIALLCGAFLALFKAAEFAKLSVKWMIKIRKRHLKRRGQRTGHIS